MVFTVTPNRSPTAANAQRAAENWLSRASNGMHAWHNRRAVRAQGNAVRQVRVAMAGAVLRAGLALRDTVCEHVDELLGPIVDQRHVMPSCWGPAGPRACRTTMHLPSTGRSSNGDPRQEAPVQQVRT